MNVALCYEHVDPSRGGCETYIADLTRRLARDGHEVHLYSCRWDAAALPSNILFHSIPSPTGPRFLRPWLFGRECERALRTSHHDVSIGFDKTWFQDVFYPQGGVYSASQAANLRKHPGRMSRFLARACKAIDPAVLSFLRVEYKQYRSANTTIIVNSEMVRRHVIEYHGIDAESLHVLHAAVDPGRFDSTDRMALRRQMRERWSVDESVPVALFLAMNYRLKGLEPLMHAVRLVPRQESFRLAVVGNPSFERYRRLARRLGIEDRVIFHGYCEESRSVYFAGDFLVHPTFYDPCSLVALEALACGLPVITTWCNGASELLRPGVDSLIVDDPHDRVRLANAIGRFLDHRYRQECAANALESAKRWTFDDHYRKMISILEAVAARKQATRSMPRAA